ncbi:hypothetical protein [Marinobacterium aestuariivivens]|uniref:FAD/NAD(P)-binding domain-containing protein n=1 Tax=Marinobacterium aestuariivivens TaxID=1698799 RepID=A0ABW1ZXT1_9GAMM
MIKTYTVVLATGMTSSPLTRFIPGEYDEYGRLKVGRDLRVIGSEAVFAAGDTAHALADDIHPTYLSCQHALELGRYAGHNALHDLVGCELIPYRQAFYATCVDLGPWGALFTTGWDREVRKTRHEGKAMKQQINNEWIYPPSPAIGKVEIFRHIALSAEIDT